MKTYISWFRTKLFPSALKSSSSHYTSDELEALIVVVLPRVFNRHRLHLELQSFDSEGSVTSAIGGQATPRITESLAVLSIN